MNRQTLLSRPASLAALALLLVSQSEVAFAQAPDPGAIASRYAENAKKNASLLRQYSWKVRLEFAVKGETKPPTVYQMRFDLDGRLQKTVLTAPPQEKPSGLGKRIKAKKMAEVKDWAEVLAEVVKKYMAPTPGNMMDFFAKATTVQGADGLMQISGKNLLMPGDTATFWVNPATNVAVRYSFTTVLQGDGIQGKVEFGNVQDGPQYAARIQVSVPTKQVTAKIESYDYLRQN